MEMTNQVETSQSRKSSSTSSESSKTDSDLTSVSSNTDENLRYGVICYPACFRICNNITSYVIWLSLANCFLNFANGIYGVVLSTMEKRFDLTSSESSWVASSYEIGPLPILLLLSVLGPRVHKPRAVALGLLSITLGCILFFIPQFTTPVYRPSDDSLDHTCSAKNLTLCDYEDESYSYYLPIFIIGRLLVGMGSAPILTSGVTYMDDCSTKERFATYYGIYLAMSVVGPALGVIGGGAFLNIFTDFYAVNTDEIGIDSSDPRWIGAWWLPFVVAAGLNVVTAIPMAGFPVDLPGAAKLRKSKVTEAHQKKDDNDTEEGINTDITSSNICKELPLAAKDMFTNPTFVMLTIFCCMDNFIISGFTVFGPKIIEVQYSISAAAAGALFGIVLLPAGAAGNIIGGLIIEKLKLSCKQIIRMEVVVSLIVTLMVFSLLLTCDPVTFAGVNVHYNSSDSSSDTEIDLSNSCNHNCSCEDLGFNPVCSYDNVQYYSPCYAGCEYQWDNDGTKEYSNCSCIAVNAGGRTVQATSNGCTVDNCNKLPIFLTGFFIAVFCIFVCLTANTAATLRCLKDAHKAVGLNTQIFFTKLLGTIPGPLLIGLTFDLTCDKWAEDCGVQSACLIYDNFALGVGLFGVCFIVKFIAMVGIIVSAIVYNPPPVCPMEVVIEPGNDVKTTQNNVYTSKDDDVKTTQNCLQQNHDEKRDDSSRLEYRF